MLVLPLKPFDLKLSTLVAVTPAIMVCGSNSDIEVVKLLSLLLYCYSETVQVH